MRCGCTPSLTTAVLPVRLHELVRQWCAAGLAVLAVSGATAHADVLRGRVIGPDGQPVAGAHVAVTGPLAAPLTATCDGDGRFALDVPAGFVSIRAFAPGLDAPVQRVPPGGAEVVLTLAVRAVSETLTVTASHVDAPLSAAPDSVSVITRDDLLARQTTTLGDALRLVPGYAVARTGGPGTVTSAFPRGGESDYTLVLVDGVRANAFGGGLDLSQVPIADAERIEVVRGPQSALHGSDAIGGVVQIITAKGGPLTVNGSGEMGGREARSGRALVRGGAGPWYGGASVAHDRDEGFTGTASDGTAVTNDDGRVTQASGTARLAPPRWHRPGGHGAVRRDRARFARAVWLESGRQLLRRGPRFARCHPPSRGRAASHAARSAARPAGCACAPMPTRPTTTSSSARPSPTRAPTPPAPTAGPRSTRPCRRPSACTAGLDGLREQGGSTFITNGAATIPVKRAAVAAYAEGRWQPHARVALGAGARVEHITRDGAGRRCHRLQSAAGVCRRHHRLGEPQGERDLGGRARSRCARRLDAPARRVRHRHPSARRVRDRLHRQPGVEAGAQPQPRSGRHADAGRRHGAGRRHLVPQHLRRPDHLGGTARGREPLHHRQHRECTGARRRARAGRAAGGRAQRARHLHVARQRGARGGRRGGPGAPAFPVGDRLLRRPRHQGSLDVTWSQGRLQAFAQAATARPRRSTWSPTSAPSAGSSKTPATPWSRPARP